MSDLTDLNPIRCAVEAAVAGEAGLWPHLVAVFPDFAQRSGDDVPVTPPPTPGSSGVFSIASRNSAAVWRDRVLFTVRTGAPAAISIDGGPHVPMTPVAGTDAWVHAATLPGPTHTYTFFAGGRDIGSNSVGMFEPLSYRLADAPQGRILLDEEIVSPAYPGARSRLWVYAPAGLATDVACPLMLWLDGEGLLGATDALNFRAQVAIDSLTHVGRIPPMAHLFLSSPQGGEPPLLYPGQLVAAAMRGFQYDVVSTSFADYLETDVLPVAARAVPQRSDGDSRAITGASSGGIAAFTAAWLRPERWGRVISSIGSFTAMRWGDGMPGGHALPAMVRRTPRQNLRIWLSDGADDLELDENGRPDIHMAGSWPLGNIALANALKSRGYDFHFRFGTAMHSHAQAGHDLPEALEWLWRGYDPSRPTQFEQEEGERAQPFFRVAISNRRAW